MANRLADALSPYLRQHADNPVDWHEWGAEAFDEARERDVPVFLSIGYAACHWCHVMAHESFEDPAIAEILNADFVPVKVDREERPDVDAIYMDVTVALTGQGGWPMSVWLTPEGHAFHAGTYFPPTPHPQVPSLRQVLAAVSEAWRDRREQVLGGSVAITEELVSRSRPPAPGILTAADVDQAIGSLAAQADDDHGGFGGAPKFPPSTLLDALVRRAAQADGPVADEAWRLAETTLTRMAHGGIYDQLGGGFSRYSVDAEWVVPHFEKMLYDNALLLGDYARAGAEARRRQQMRTAVLCDRVVADTVAWLLREMTTPQGAFAASLDADSLDESGHAHEGAFYVWSPSQLRDALGTADAARAAEVFGVTETGTFEHGASVLQRIRETDGRWFSDVTEQLRRARDRRPRPARDDKVVAAWNGWAITALLEAAMLRNRPGWIAPARRAARAVLDIHLTHADDGGARLARVSRDGVASPADGVAEDYAGLALGLATLAAATGEREWLDHALALLRTLDADFVADDGGVHDAPNLDPAGGVKLVRRPRDLGENATPSGSGAALRACRLVYRLTGDRHWNDRADAVARTLAPYVARAPRAAGWALADAVAELGARRPAEVAVVGDEEGGALTWTAWRDAPPGSVVVTGAPDTGIPLLHGRPAVGGHPTAYVCHQGMCDLPVTGVDALQSRLV